MSAKNKKYNNYPKLYENIDADIAIIGGGLAGISTAYMLSGQGKSIAVLEAKTIGSGATTKTTAFITQAIDTSLADLVSMFGRGRAKMVWESGKTAIDAIEKIVRKEKIECRFMRCSYYAYAKSEEEFKEIEEDYRIAKKFGFGVRLHKNNSLPFPNHGYLELRKQAKFSPLDYLSQLAERSAKKGVIIYENSRVNKISGHQKYKITTSGGSITAKQVIIATYDPLGNPKETRFKKGMYKSYVYKVAIQKPLPEALYVDLENPYHYFRVDKEKGSYTMLIGGEDHRAELPLSPKKNFSALKEHFENIFPGVKYKILDKWSGPILEPSDGLPLIGEFSPGKFVACAFSGNGMTYSTISALMFKKLLLGKNHTWKKLYDPKRTPTLKQFAKKAVDYTGEFFGGAVKNIFK